jgi:hypothetical protein
MKPIWYRLRILRNSGYVLSYSRPVVWTDPVRRQAFSEDVISDHDEVWLKARLAEEVPITEFWFHFRYLSRDPIKDCKEILSDLKLTALLPVVRTGVRYIEIPISS